MDTILSFIKKQWKLSISLMVSLFSFVVALILVLILIPTKYESLSKITTQKDVDGKQMQSIATLINSQEMVDTTFNWLSSNDIVHANGSSILRKEIVSGLRFDFTSVNAIISFYFNNQDSTIVQDVLNAHIELSLATINEKYHHLAGDVTIVSYATEPYKVQSNRYQYLIGTVVVSFTCSFMICSGIEAKKNKKGRTIKI